MKVAVNLPIVMIQGTKVDDKRIMPNAKKTKL